MIEQVKSLPPRDNAQVSMVGKDVREFLRAGMKVARIKIDGKSAKQIKNSVDGYCRSHDLKGKVACRVREGETYLIRLETIR